MNCPRKPLKAHRYTVPTGTVRRWKLVRVSHEGAARPAVVLVRK